MSKKTEWKMTRRDFLCGAVVGAGGALLTACGAPATPAPTNPPPATATPKPAAPGPTAPPEPTTLKMIDLGGWYTDTYLDAHIEEFQKQYPEIAAYTSVEPEIFPWGTAHDKYVTLIKAGRSPDFGTGLGEWMGEFVERGALEPVEEYFDAEFMSQFHDVWLSQCMWKGNLYALPWLGSNRLPIYRPSWFEDAGLNPPDTVDNIMEAARALHNPPERYGIALSLGRNKNTLEFFLEMAWPMGFELFDDDETPTEVLFNNDVGVEALEWYVELCKYTPPGIENWATFEAQTLFQDGKAAMIVHGPWVVKQAWAKYPDFDDWAITGSPMGTRKACLGVHDMYMLLADSEHKEEAAAFMKSRFSYSVFGPMVTDRGYVPVSKNLVDGIDYYTTQTRLIGAYVDAIPDIKFRPRIAAWARIDDSLAVAIQRAVLGEATPKEALDQAAVEAYAALAA
jgi:multiple sugar transport system substrate-binding protein